MMNNDIFKNNLLFTVGIVFLVLALIFTKFQIILGFIGGVLSIISLTITTITKIKAFFRKFF